jgi:tetratricopeptide (TPR) repeat protein
MVPLERFAYADLLLFQNKDKEAEALLDSISIAFPKHPLSDDILMLRAKLAQKHRDYLQALDYLKKVYEPCKDCGKDDLLRDDALFRTAEIYERFLKKPDQAQVFYERLIMEYPGSTFVQSARVKLLELQNSTEVIP